MDKTDIGNFVKQTREKQKLLQRELADKAQVRRQTVIDIENATNGYAVDKLLDVLDALDYELTFVKQQDTFNFKNVLSNTLKKKNHERFIKTIRADGAPYCFGEEGKWHGYEISPEQEKLLVKFETIYKPKTKKQLL